jgi:hypothetical protein
MHECYVAPFDQEGLSVDQGVSDLAMRGFENPTERRTRDIHTVRRLFLVQALVVGQADGLSLVQGKCHLLQEGGGDASGFEEGGGRLMADGTLRGRS